MTNRASVSGLRGYGIAAGAVAAATLAVAAIAPLDASNGTMLYLGAVLLTAVSAGLGPAIAVSLTAFVVSNFLFTEPRYTLDVRDPADVIALVTFLVVAIVTSALAAAVRERAESAEERAREARLLHDLSDLLAVPSLPQALDGLAQRLSTEVGVERVGILVGDADLGRVAGGDPDVVRRLRTPGSADQVLGSGRAATGETAAEPGRWVRVARPHGERTPHGDDPLTRVPIRQGAQVIGHVGMLSEGRPDLDRRDARILDTAADQIGVAVERHRLRQEATDAEALRRADELKSALLDAVSHDLRTPLAGIIAAAGSIRQTDVEWTDGERAEFAETIENEAQRLNRIVGNLLDLSRIQGGSLKPSRTWHDPALLLRDSVERLRPAARDHRLHVEVAEDLEPAFIDPVEIDQVVANLVENALKYTPPGSEIRVTAFEQDGVLEIAVDDSGPGLPPASIGRLFEPFYRAGQPDRAQGSGLGLAVARGLVRAHGGEIRAENRPEGGARFVFRIPSPERPRTGELA